VLIFFISLSETMNKRENFIWFVWVFFDRFPKLLSDRSLNGVLFEFVLFTNSKVRTCVSDKKARFLGMAITRFVFFFV